MTKDVPATQQPPRRSIARYALAVVVGVGHHHVLDVLGLERLGEQRIVEQIDLADRQIVRRAPVAVEQFEIVGGPVLWGSVDVHETSLCKLRRPFTWESRAEPPRLRSTARDHRTGL